MEIRLPKWRSRGSRPGMRERVGNTAWGPDEDDRLETRIQQGIKVSKKYKAYSHSWRRECVNAAEGAAIVPTLRGGSPSNALRREVTCCPQTGQESASNSVHRPYPSRQPLCALRSDDTEAPS